MKIAQGDPTSYLGHTLTWEKGRQYLQKMGGLILAFSIVIWALGYFNVPTTSHDEQQETAACSYLEYLGRALRWRL